MIFVAILLGIYVLVGLLYWLWTAWAMYCMAHRVVYLGRADVPEPPHWPKLSLIAAACNEGDKVGPAARTLLALDYPDLEIILVDDRSTDETGEVLDRLAAEDPRLRVLHVTELPDGWLGKVHALHRALGEATGEWVLFTDADVHFQPRALKTAVGYCLPRGLDYMAAFPIVWRTNLLLEAVIAASIRQLIATVRPWQLGDPQAGGYLGVGAFNLVRRSALAATKGFEHLRMEVADDAGLALMLKDSGAACELVNAFDLLGLHWYRSVGEIMGASERLFATAVDCRFRKALTLAPLALALELAPFLAPLALLLDGPLRYVGAAGATVSAAWVAASVLMSRWVRQPAWPALLSPLTAPLAAFAVVRAAVLGRRQGGIVWRGTLYPTEALRAGKRLRLP